MEPIRAWFQSSENIGTHLNPFEPNGISAEKIHFLDTFALLCLLEPSPAISTKEQTQIDHNQHAIVMEGRKPGLMLKQNDQPITFTDWGHDLLNKMANIASLMDDANNTTRYSDAITNQKQKIDDPEKTPSAKILHELKEKDSDLRVIALKS